MYVPLYTKFEPIDNGQRTLVTTTCFCGFITCSTVDKPRRHAILDMLSTLEPVDVYSITEQGGSERGESHLTVVYYRGTCDCEEEDNATQP